MASAVGSSVDVAQIGHTHENTVSEGGAAVSGPFSGHLGSVDPTDSAAWNSRIGNVSFEDLTGYENVHQSNTNSQFVFAQDSIGANAGN